jgi:hypothetical protein
MSAPFITEAMVDAADEAFDGTYEANLEIGSSHWTDNRKVALTAALTAALAVSGYGDVVEALRRFPLPSQSMSSQANYRVILDWLYAGPSSPAELICALDLAAIARAKGEAK